MKTCTRRKEMKTDENMYEMKTYTRRKKMYTKFPGKDMYKMTVASW